MNIFAIDIGVGTQDVMIFDTDITRDFESAYKLVLPSPTRILADELRKTQEDVIIFGDTMGGGPFTHAVLDHLRDYRVYMTEDAARTLRDDLAIVRGWGVELVSGEQEIEELSETAAPIKITDFNLQLLSLLASFGIDTNFDVIAIAVQDHGVAPAGLTDREHRFQMIEENVGGGLESFAYLDGVPDNLSRMQSLYRSLRRWYDGHILLMDTGPAAVLGSLEDERVKDKSRVVCVNVGNAHTIAISLNDGQIVGVFEHHTHLLDKPKLETYLTRLCDGTLTFPEVFNDGGHGAVVRGANQPEIISVTGPNRRRMAGLGVFAAPGGDMMMTGTVGLIKAVLNRL
ncbi:MAG: DUF1786 domain-containing protein [Methanomicrobia archaeon]|nr:DUF1786 domain-containing protein [Methanomicrobia archaeon]